VREQLIRVEVGHVVQTGLVNAIRTVVTSVRFVMSATRRLMISWNALVSLILLIGLRLFFSWKIVGDFVCNNIEVMEFGLSADTDSSLNV